MVYFLQITLTAWRGVCATFHLIAISATIFRLVHRHRLRRLWWDDYWAGIALVFSLGYFGSMWLRREPLDKSLSKNTMIVTFWLTTLTFPCEVWSARLSIAFSIVRLVPERTTYRRWLYGLTVLFGMMWLGLLLQKMYSCAGNSRWHNNVQVQCFLGDPVGIVTLTTDIISDTCLILIPLHLLRPVRLLPAQRRLFLAIFCSSLFSSIFGVLYAIFVFMGDDTAFEKKRGLLISLTANMKAAVTLLVSNLLVIVTYFYRTFRRGQDLESDAAAPSTKPVPVSDNSGNPRFTTTDLSSMPTFETTSTFDTTPRSQPSQPSITSSRLVNTAGSQLPTISEAETAQNSMVSSAVNARHSTATSS